MFCWEIYNFVLFSASLMMAACVIFYWINYDVQEHTVKLFFVFWFFVVCAAVSGGFMKGHVHGDYKIRQLEFEYAEKELRDGKI